jgi:hypothetical protein
MSPTTAPTAARVVASGLSTLSVLSPKEHLKQTPKPLFQIPSFSYGFTLTPQKDIPVI